MGCGASSPVHLPPPAVPLLALPAPAEQRDPSPPPREGKSDRSPRERSPRDAVPRERRGKSGSGATPRERVSSKSGSSGATPRERSSKSGRTPRSRATGSGSGTSLGPRPPPPAAAAAAGAGEGPTAVAPPADGYMRKSKKRAKEVVTPAPPPLTSSAPAPGPEEPEWAALRDDPAELTRRVCAYMMAHTVRTPSGDARKKVEAGQEALGKLKRTLSGAGLPQGDGTTRLHIEEFCGWVQTLYFDGITTDEHGAELRQLARSMNQETERLLREQVFSEAGPVPAPAPALQPAPEPVPEPAALAVAFAREMLPRDQLVLQASTPPAAAPPPALIGVAEALGPLGSTAGFEGCRTIAACTVVFARGVEGKFGPGVTPAPLGRDQTPAVGYDLGEDWLVSGLAVRRSLSMAAAAAAAVSGGVRATILGLEIAESAEDLQHDAKCQPVATLAWGSGSGSKNGGAKAAGAGVGPARWTLDWGLRARYIRLTVLGTTAGKKKPAAAVRIGDLEVHGAYTLAPAASSGKTPRGSSRKPPTLKKYQATVLKIETELAESVKLKIEEPVALVEPEEMTVLKKKRKLAEKELTEFLVVYARDQSSSLEMAKRTLDAKRGSWKPLIYAGPGLQLSSGSGKKAASAAGSARQDWGAFGDGLGSAAGLPAAGFDLWASWVISGVTVSLAPKPSSSKKGGSGSGNGGAPPTLKLALEAAGCSRALGRDELCTRLTVFEVSGTAEGAAARHTLDRPVSLQYPFLHTASESHTPTPFASSQYSSRNEIRHSPLLCAVACRCARGSCGWLYSARSRQIARRSAAGRLRRRWRP